MSNYPEAEVKEKHGNPTAFHECFPNYSKMEQPIGKEREYTRKGGREGAWFTITLIIEFCKLNHQLATTLRQNSKRNMGSIQLSMNVSLVIQKWNNQ
jgi:hypothetical protein